MAPKRRKPKIRQSWKMNPVTRVVLDKKKYNRRRSKEILREDGE